MHCTEYMSTTLVVYVILEYAYLSYQYLYPDRKLQQNCTCTGVLCVQKVM